MNRRNSLKHLQHFYANDSNKKKEKEKKKKIFNLQLFVTYSILRNLLIYYEEDLWTQNKVITTKIFLAVLCHDLA